MRVAERPLSRHGTPVSLKSTMTGGSTGIFPPPGALGIHQPTKPAHSIQGNNVGFSDRNPNAPVHEVTYQSQPQPQPQHPPIGPAPLLLSRAEVDDMYDLLSALLSALEELAIPHVLIAGSLLGAVRSQSILFNDDGVDVAIIDDAGSGNAGSKEDDECGRTTSSSPYERMVQHLPAILGRAATERNRTDAGISSGSMSRGVEYSFQRRPKLACDRVKSTAGSREVWIDIFVLRRYRCKDDLLRIVARDENGNDQQQEEYIHSILSSIEETAPAVSMDHRGVQFPFPLYHFDNREAIELWPREYFLPNEIFPIVKDFKFGPLQNVPGPRMPLQSLRRFFGDDCFTHYVRIEQNRGKKRGDTTSWQDGEKIPLSDDQYLPVQHSRRNKRIWSDHNRRRLENYISNGGEAPSVEMPSSGSSNLARSKTFRSLSQQNYQQGEISSTESSEPLKEELAASFEAAVRRHTASSPDTPNFDKELRNVMEQHIAKARLNREKSRQHFLGTSKFENNNIASLSIGSSVSVPYPSLRTERPFLFDVDTYPLHQILADTIGVEDLSMIHEHPIKDKRLLMDALTHRESRLAFHECYDNFVTSFCIPLLHSLAMTQNIFTDNSSSRRDASNAVTYRYQAFPCIRVIRPGEFSIGPHCDIAYGHSIGNINFHIPLTPAFGTNALYTESHPGREDWHPLTTKATGLGYVFDGSRCLHFALDNTTDRTRVSIDFRIAITRCRDGRLPPGSVDHGVDDLLCSPAILQDRYASAGPGYYEEAVIHMGGGVPNAAFTPGPVVMKTGSTRNLYGQNALVDPDERVGFPFT